MNQVAKDMQVEALESEEQEFVHALTTEQLALVAGGAPTVNSI